MPKRALAIGLSILVLVLLVIYYEIGPKPRRELVRVVTPPSIIASLPVWVADRERMFENANLDVAFVDVTNSRMMVEAMLAGNADVLPAVSLVDLTAVGSPGNQALMHMVMYSHSRMRKQPAFESILVGTGSTTSTLKDIEGKKVAVYPGISSELAVRHFLKVNGVDSSRVTFVKLPPQEHEPALLKGDVSAIHVYEPFRSASLENRKTRELTGSIYASFTDPSAIGTSAIARSFLRNRPEVAQRFLEVWDRAVVFIRENPGEARRILQEKLGLSNAVAQSATWVDATTTRETDFTVISNTVRTAQEASIISEAFQLEKDMVYVP